MTADVSQDSSDPEVFLIRATGGPHEGTRVITADQMPWPLPDTLPAGAAGGVYRKVSESGLPPQPADSRVKRGAEYRWAPAPSGEVAAVGGEGGN